MDAKRNVKKRKLHFTSVKISKKHTSLLDSLEKYIKLIAKKHPMKFISILNETYTEVTNKAKLV